MTDADVSTGPWVVRKDGGGTAWVDIGGGTLLGCAVAGSQLSGRDGDVYRAYPMREEDARFLVEARERLADPNGAYRAMRAAGLAAAAALDEMEEIGAAQEKLKRRAAEARAKVDAALGVLWNLLSPQPKAAPLPFPDEVERKP